MPKPIHFEYQEVPQKGLTVVALDSRLSDYGFQPVMKDGKPVMSAKGTPMVRKPEVTIKDCRHIDGCVYFCLGRRPEREVNDLIEKFQKLKKEKGWKPSPSLIVPDDRFIFD